MDDPSASQLPPEIVPWREKHFFWPVQSKLISLNSWVRTKIDVHRDEFLEQSIRWKVFWLDSNSTLDLRSLGASAWTKDFVPIVYSIQLLIAASGRDKWQLRSLGKVPDSDGAWLR